MLNTSISTKLPEELCYIESKEKRIAVQTSQLKEKGGLFFQRILAYRTEDLTFSFKDYSLSAVQLFLSYLELEKETFQKQMLTDYPDLEDRQKQLSKLFPIAFEYGVQPLLELLKSPPFACEIP